MSYIPWVDNMRLRDRRRFQRQLREVFVDYIASSVEFQMRQERQAACEACHGLAEQHLCEITAETRGRNLGLNRAIILHSFHQYYSGVIEALDNDYRAFYVAMHGLRPQFSRCRRISLHQVMSFTSGGNIQMLLRDRLTMVRVFDRLYAQPEMMYSTDGWDSDSDREQQDAQPRVGSSPREQPFQGQGNEEEDDFENVD